MGIAPHIARGLKFDGRIPIYRIMEASLYCKKPDRHGGFNRRCMQLVKPRKELKRQCRLAAQEGSTFCHMHQPAPIDHRPPSIWDGLIQYVKSRFTRNPK